ncbi:hypothetical protein BJX99DRAFT_108807 [Aspergillus californicus]
MAMGRLQNWTVTPLKKPDEDGETEKYTTCWGSDSFTGISDHGSGPCNRYGCAWNTMARIQARRPTWNPLMVFEAWLLRRTIIRERGFAL